MSDRLLHGVLAGALSAGLVGLLAWVWPAEPGVVLTAAERLQVIRELGLQGLLGGAMLGVVLGRSRWGAAVAALLPALMLAALALAPRSGKLSVEVDESVLMGLSAVGAAAAIGALGRFARGTFGAVVVLLVGALGVAFGPGRPGSPATVRKGSGATGPDILLLTLDTVRADHLDFHSGDVDKAFTPNLSALAARGQVFDQAFAPVAITAPSHATMLSGVSPRAHGVRRNGAELPASLPWVPELLAAAGYETRAFVSASVLEGSLGFWRGFTAFDSQFVGEEGLAGRRDLATRLTRGHGLLSWRGWRRHAGSAWSRSGEDTVAVALDDPTPGSGPRFTWVHLYDAHAPYEASEAAAKRVGLEDGRPMRPGLLPALLQEGAVPMSPEEEARGRLLYRAGLEDLDTVVGGLLAGLPEDTVIIVVGDHGESLGEHGYTFHHGKLPYAPDTRVPLVVVAPGVSPGRVETPVAVADVAPTLLELAGLPVPDEVGGVSLLHPDPMQVVFSASWSQEFPQPPTAGEDLGPWAGLAARQGPLTAAVTRWEAAASYDRRADPRELAPYELDEAAPSARAAWLQVALRGELLQPVEGDARVQGHMLEALEALGYMDGGAASKPPPEAPAPLPVTPEEAP